MPFADADNTPVDINRLPTGSNVKEGESLDDYLTRVFADDAGNITLGNGQSSSDSSTIDEPADAPDGASKDQPTAPPTAPQDAPDASGSTEGASGDGGAVAPSLADTPTPYPNTAPVESPFDIIEFAGKQLTRAQAQSLLGVYEWAVANPDRAAAVDAYMQGQGQFVSDSPTSTQQQVPSTPSPQPQSPIPATPNVDPYASLDPALADRLRAHDTILAYQVQQQEQERANNLRNQQLSNQTAVNTATTEFAAKYSLSPEQIQTLAQVTASAQILPGILQSSPDMRSAVTTALEMTFWHTPAFREAELNRQATSLANQGEKQQKQQKLIGASGGVGSAPKQVDRSTPPPSRDRNERDKQMAAVIAQELSGANN